MALSMLITGLNRLLGDSLELRKSLDFPAKDPHVIHNLDTFTRELDFFSSSLTLLQCHIEKPSNVLSDAGIDNLQAMEGDCTRIATSLLASVQSVLEHKRDSSNTSKKVHFSGNNLPHTWTEFFKSDETKSKRSLILYSTKVVNILLLAMNSSDNNGERTSRNCSSKEDCLSEQEYQDRRILEGINAWRAASRWTHNCPRDGRGRLNALPRHWIKHQSSQIGGADVISRTTREYRQSLADQSREPTIRLQQENASLQTYINELEAGHRPLRDRLNEAKRENEELQRQIKQLKLTHADERRQMDESKQKLREDCRKLEREKEIAEQQIGDETRRRTECERDLQSERYKTAQLKSRGVRLEQDCQAYEDDLHDAKIRSDAQQQRYDNTCQRFENERRTTRRIRHERDSAKDAISDWKQETDRQRGEKYRLQWRSDDLATKNYRLHHRLEIANDHLMDDVDDMSLD